MPGHSESLMIPRTSSSLRLLQQIRDEAHRTAVAFQRKQRKQRTLHSALMDIPGIGSRTAQKLLRHFGSVKKVMEASAEELETVVGPAIALTLADIVRAIDGDELFTQCILGLPGCGEDKPCPIHDQWRTHRSKLKQLFESYTLDTLLHKSFSDLRLSFC